MTVKNYSYYIYELVDIGRIAGIRFRLHDDSLPDNVAGRCDYTLALIRINDPSAKSALMTIAHEIGHYFSFLRNREKDYSRWKREQLAFLYGWAVLKYLGAPIHKQDWRVQNEFEIKQWEASNEITNR